MDNKLLDEITDFKPNDISEFKPDEVTHRCAFCYRDYNEVFKMFKGGASVICSDCIDKAYNLLHSLE